MSYPLDESDQRFINAKNKTISQSNASIKPIYPSGKFIRKYRGSKNVLLLLYVLDPKGFGGNPNSPAIGFAISFPEIENDTKIPYKVNTQFIEEMFAVPKDAEENPEDDDDE